MCSTIIYLHSAKPANKIQVIEKFILILKKNYYFIFFLAAETLR